MIRKAVVGLTFFLLAVPLLADEKLDDRMMHAASILQEIRGSLDEEAPGVLNDAYAVAVFPEFVKVGLLGGVQHGRGVLAKRLESGEWSKPAFARITSGSFGLQFGVSMSQLLIVFKDPKAVEAISGGQFTIGADAGYAAGELGGMAGAGTDNRFENEIVAMARSRGLFAGVALEGGVLRIEKDSNVEFYNDAIGLDGRRLLEDTEVETPPVAQHFRIVLAESVPPLSEHREPVSGENPNVDIGRSNFDSSRHSVRQANFAPDAPRQRNGLKPNPAQASAADPLAAAQAPATQGAARTAAATPVQQQAAEGLWVTPEARDLPSGNSRANGRAPRNSRLSGELASRVRGALWDGAVDLAGNALRNNPDAQGAKMAAKAGGKLVDAAAPKPGGSGSLKPASGRAGGPDQWIEVPDGELQLASASPEAPKNVAASSRAALTNAGGSTSGPSFTGPPSPSEWPKEWLQQQAISEACAQGS